MFEEISKPLKGKGKEKDLGKRRAYVRVVTSLGGASLNLELYCEKVRFDSYSRSQLSFQLRIPRLRRLATISSCWHAQANTMMSHSIV